MLCVLHHNNLNRIPRIAEHGSKVHIDYPGLELAIINSIACWREQLAIERDKNRRRVLPDDDIVLIATSKPESVDQLSKTGQLSRYFNSDELESLFVIVKKSYNIPESEWPVRINTRPSPEEKKKLEKLQSFINRKADELKISGSILCARKELTSLFNGSRDCRVLTGWRRTIIGDELLNLLEA